MRMVIMCHRPLLLNVCNVVNKELLEGLFGKSIGQLQNQFTKWSKGKLRQQSI